VDTLSAKPDPTPSSLLTLNEIRLIKDDAERNAVFQVRERWELDVIISFGYEEMKRACTYEDMWEALQELARHLIVPDAWRKPDNSSTGVFVREQMQVYRFMTIIEDPFEYVDLLDPKCIFKEGDWDGMSQYDDDWSHARRDDNPAMNRCIMRYYEVVAKEFDEFWQSNVMKGIPERTAEFYLGDD
jgi:hypothetical protein